MPEEWPCREYWAGWEGSCPSLWDFSSWQADVVTINLGTNDFAFGNPTQEEFRNGYRSFLQQVRSKYPNALIAAIEPIQHSCNGEAYPLLTGIVNGMEQAVIDLNDPKIIYYETGRTSDPWLDCTLSTQDFMDFTHPTVQGNEKFAARLLETMTNDVRRFFPEKCGGSGSTCVVGAPIAAPVAAPVVAPVFIPSPVALPPPSNDSSSPKMMAYLGNWQACPHDDQIAQYTHIVIAFAVSYSWNPSKNACSETCEISQPATCGNEVRPDLISKWQSMGKKVILSFGGAGMGGSWPSDNNDCWEYCYGREEQVVNRLTDIVTELSLDGVDIDYEYFYEDNQNGSGFSKGQEAQYFLKEVTLGLRSSLPAGSEVIHVPMEPDVVPGTGYYRVLQEIADSLDYLMPQYYNGYVRPFADYQGAKSHYGNVLDLFGGDSSKVVFGFCINDCPNFNLNGDEAAFVMEQLANDYPCNGGAFFWVANDDTGGAWSSRVNQQLAINAASNGCSVSSPVASPVASPTVRPVASPTARPVASPTFSPVASPTSSPVASPTARPIASPTASTGCVAVPQSSLPDGSWATTQEQCDKCSEGYQWWPCDTSEPALCDCNGGGNNNPPVPSPTAAPIPSPTSAPVPSPSSSNNNSNNNCSAIPQNELPSGSWATSNEQCNKCAEGYPWWPCDLRDPPLCRGEGCGFDRRRRMRRRSLRVGQKD